MSKKSQVMNFLEVITDNGETFISQGSIKADHAYIKSILKSQGFWSGVGYRYYFDKYMNLTKIEEKIYGGN